LDSNVRQYIPGAMVEKGAKVNKGKSDSEEGVSTFYPGGERDVWKEKKGGGKKNQESSPALKPKRVAKGA